MTDNDVVVATPPTDDDSRLDQLVAEELVANARAEAVDLVGPNGLLGDLTKKILEIGSVGRGCQCAREAGEANRFSDPRMRRNISRRIDTPQGVSLFGSGNQSMRSSTR